MPAKSTSLNIETALVNALNVIEQLQNLTISGDNTTVDGRGIADRYESKQVTKQKQVIELMYHWYNSSTELEATNLDISLWDIGGVAFLGEVKGGSINMVNTAIETSSIADTYEFVQTTSTGATISTNTLPETVAALTGGVLTDTISGMAVLVSITFAGENIQIPGILKSGKHTIRRGEAQTDDCTIELQGTPSTPGDASSLIYLFLIGAALTSFDFDTGVNEYQTAGGQYAAMTRMDIRFADKALIEQSLTLEMQGGMVVSAGV